MGRKIFLIKCTFTFSIFCGCCPLQNTQNGFDGFALHIFLHSWKLKIFHNWKDPSAAADFPLSVKPEQSDSILGFLEIKDCESSSFGEVLEAGRRWAWCFSALSIWSRPYFSERCITVPCSQLAVPTSSSSLHSINCVGFHSLKE